MTDTGRKWKPTGNARFDGLVRALADAKQMRLDATPSKPPETGGEPCRK